MLSLPEGFAEGLAVSTPEVNASESQSGGVIERLEKLLGKFIAERTTLEKEEMDSEHAHAMLMLDLNSQFKQDEVDRGESAEPESKQLRAKAGAEGDLRSTTDTMWGDMKYLGDLTATYEQEAPALESAAAPCRED